MSTKFAAAFVANVRAELARRKWTQQQLAEQSGVHYVGVSRLLSGKYAPSLETCQRIADALELDPAAAFSSPR